MSGKPTPLPNARTKRPRKSSSKSNNDNQTLSPTPLIQTLSPPVSNSALNLPPNSTQISNNNIEIELFKTFLSEPNISIIKELITTNLQEANYKVADLNKTVACLQSDNNEYNNKIAELEKIIFDLTNKCKEAECVNDITMQANEQLENKIKELETKHKLQLDAENKKYKMLSLAYDLQKSKNNSVAKIPDSSQHRIHAFLVIPNWMEIEELAKRIEQKTRINAYLVKKNIRSGTLIVGKYLNTWYQFEDHKLLRDILNCADDWRKNNWKLQNVREVHGEEEYKQSQLRYAKATGWRCLCQSF